MNWILTLILYIYLFIQYYLFGSFCVSFSGYESSLSNKLVFGFLFTFFIMFLVGVPCQMISTNWDTYFYLITFILILVNVVAIRYLKINNGFSIKMPKITRINLLNFLKSNWVCILFIALFSFYSISNNLPIYQQNYDDYYYIGKIVNLIGSDHLLNENYYNGAIIPDSHLDLTRVINTYELSYGYFLTVFHIKATFFCRISMMIHNYFFFSIIYKLLAELLIRKKDYSQYALVPFFIFLIPLGYLQNGFPIATFRIASYDLWQFQTASFYGGSIVRMLALPTLAIYSFPLVKKIELKKIVMLGILSLSFVSFSTIFLQVFILFLIVIMGSKFLFMLYESIKYKNKKMIFFYSLMLLILISILILTKWVDNLSFINTASFRECIDNFIPYVLGWFENDAILKYGFIPCILLILLVKGSHTKIFSLSFVALYLMFSTMYFMELYAISSFNVFFVINRTIASVQYIIMLIAGVVVILAYLKFLNKKILPGLISAISIVSVIFFFQTHIDRFMDYIYLGSGIANSGWNFSRILDLNNTMTLNIFTEVGDYFNTLKYGNYKLYAPETFTYDGEDTVSAGLVTESNRIQIHIGNGFSGFTGEENKILSDFTLGGDCDVSIVLNIIKSNDIQYILLFNQKNAEILLENGGTLILNSNELINDYYLVKI